MSEYCNFINGRFILSESKEIVPNLNPANLDDVIKGVRLSTRAEAKAAIEAAQSAFDGWRSTPAPARGRIVAKAAQLMDAAREELSALLTREEGKTLGESRGELARSINVVEFCAAEGRRQNGETIASELPNNFAYTIKQPHGVVACITPWNFPVAIPVWKIAPALVAGNTVVFKPATLTPGTASKIVELFSEAGLPPGVLNLVIGSGSVVGDEITNHPYVRAISFTGSNEVGLKMYEQAARRGIKVQSEMGGKNPVVILEDADLDLAVESTVQGAFGSTGQRCTATSRAIVVNEIADEFVKRLVTRTSKLILGDGADPKTNVGPAVDKHQFETVLKYLTIGREDGAEMIYGGRASEPQGIKLNGVTKLDDPALQRGFYLEPTVFDRVTPDMRIAQEEIFGPVLSVMRARDFDEAMHWANNVQFGLSSSIFSNDPNRIFRFVDKIETGMTHVNSATTGGEAHIPFGGIKGSGLGEREQGSTALDFYSELKVVYLDYTGQKRTSNIY